MLEPHGECVPVIGQNFVRFVKVKRQRIRPFEEQDFQVDFMVEYGKNKQKVEGRGCVWVK